MKKLNKIMVCLSQSEEERLKMISRLLVNFGFARTPHEARKVIALTPFDIDLPSAYFVAALNYNFRTSLQTTHRMYSMAISGNLILVGAKRVPPEMEFMCEIYTTSDF